MKAITPYLFFNGTCAEALRFYEKALGGKIERLMTFGDAPPGQSPPGVDPRSVMHAQLSVGDLQLMASDGMPVGQPPMQSFALSLSFDTVDDAKKAFDALAEGATVTMPLGPTFWSQAFAMLSDRYGTPWMINGPEAAMG